MLRFFLSRLFFSIIIILAGTTFIFFLTALGGGDPARLMLGDTATEKAVIALHKEIGLDLPIYQQYMQFMIDFFRGDLGVSWYSREPTIERILKILPNTLILTITATIIAWIMGVSVGIISAYTKGSFYDAVLRILVMCSISLPGFVIALISILIFSLYLGWFPTSGIGDLRHLVLPAGTLGMFSAGLLARITRSSMLDVLNKDYVMAARARGVPEFWVLIDDAFRNVLLTIVTFSGLQFGILMGGSVVTEVVFAWPGMGRSMINAVFSRDFPMIRSITIVYLIIFIIVNFIVDILYANIDPRIKIY